MVQSTSSIKEYNKTLIDLGNKRKLIRMSQDIQKNISNWEDWETIITDVSSEMNKLEWITQDKTMWEFYLETLDLIDSLRESSTPLVWYSFWSQFEWIDKATWWIIPWKIYRVWWASNVWKSWLMYNFLISVLWQWAKTTFFALENDEVFTLKNLFWLKWGKNALPHLLQQDPTVSFDEEAHWFTDKDFRIETKYKTLSSIFRKAVKNKSDVIFIDYIQAIKAEKSYSSKDAKFEDIALQIQAFANKYKIAVVDLSQLSNEVKRWGSNWSWSDEFKWSWELKSAADVWIHIYEWLESSDWYLSNRKIKLTKNRLWPWVWSIVDYMLNFHKGWKWETDLADNNK